MIAVTKPTVWRVRMKSQDELVDPNAARAFAVENGVIGAGWGLSRAPAPSPVPDLCEDVNLYLHHARLVYPDDSRVRPVADIFANQMQIGDFCWLYVTHTGEYWCCRIEGNFSYRTGGNFELYGLHLVRPCKWAKAGPADAVPGVVRRAFAGPFGTVSKLNTDAQTAIDAAEICLDLRKPAPKGDLFAVAGPEDLEDLVSLYLQELGWSVFPSTSKVSMASYEFVLVHRETGQRAGVQVKSGNIGYLNQAVAEDFDVFFVFMGKQNALVHSDDHRLKRIERSEIQSFAQRCWALLPRRLQVQWPLV